MAKSPAKAPKGRRKALGDSPPPGGPTGEADFQQNVRESIARLRDSVAAVLHAIHAEVRVPHSVSRNFGVDKNLTSKLARVIHATDPYEAALDVPGPEAMRIFSKAMRNGGAGAEVLDALEESVQIFQSVVQTHCGGDRATFDMLVANLSAAGTQKQQKQLETFRKSMFRGMSAVYGVQARVHISAHFVLPNHDDPEMVDVAVVGGLVDFKRIRSDAEWAVASMRAVDHPGHSAGLKGAVPLDPTVGEGEAPLLREFCSANHPPLKVVPSGTHLRRLVVPAGPVGDAHSMTLYTGWRHPKISSRWATEPDDDSEHFVLLSTPVELVIHDLLVHRDLEYARNPSVMLYNQLPGVIAYPNGPRDSGLLPLAERVRDLDGAGRAGCPDVPEYSKLVASVIDRLGYAAPDFLAFRTQIVYPPIPSMLLYRYAMPAKP